MLSLGPIAFASSKWEKAYEEWHCVFGKDATRRCEWGYRIIVRFRIASSLHCSSFTDMQQRRRKSDKMRAWINNYIHVKPWDAIIHRYVNANGGLLTAVEERAWLSNHILWHIMGVITCPYHTLTNILIDLETLTFNSLWPSNNIWRRWKQSWLFQVMMAYQSYKYRNSRHIVSWPSQNYCGNPQTLDNEACRRTSFNIKMLLNQNRISPYNDRLLFVMEKPIPGNIVSPVSQMRAPPGGLSRTSGKLWQDYSNCYMFWT